MDRGSDDLHQRRTANDAAERDTRFINIGNRGDASDFGNGV